MEFLNKKRIYKNLKLNSFECENCNKISKTNLILELEDFICKDFKKIDFPNVFWKQNKENFVENNKKISKDKNWTENDVIHTEWYKEWLFNYLIDNKYFNVYAFCNFQNCFYVNKFLFFNEKIIQTKTINKNIDIKLVNKELNENEVTIINELLKQMLDCYKKGYYSPVIMIARKLLIHLSVLAGEEYQKNKKMIIYTDFLKTQIHPKKQLVFDKIRQVGNLEMHQLRIAKKSDAEILIQAIKIVINDIFNPFDLFN